jgi:hypothetical protein
MRRFELTSEAFKGTAEVWFNFEGLLCRMDFIDSELSYEQLLWLCKNVSPHIDTFAALLPKTIKIKDVPFEITLDDFKREYGYSRNFHLLEPVWIKYNKKEIVLIYFRAIEYRKWRERNKWCNPKIAASWLTQKQYLNDWKKM